MPDCNCEFGDPYLCLSEQLRIKHSASVDAGGCKCECHKDWPVKKRMPIDYFDGGDGEC